MTWLRLQRTAAVDSSPKVLGRVAQAVEPFCFNLVPRELLPPLLKGERDRLWQEPDLSGQVEDCQADKLWNIHKVSFVPAR